MRNGPPTPLVGIEAEFLGWDQNPNDVALRLVDAGFTLPDYEMEHSYHCDCTQCYRIGNSGPLVPVLWKRQHDASLTRDGTEWISSPFPAVGPFFAQALEALEILSEGDLTTERQGRMDNRRGDAEAEAGLHIHCSTPSSRSQTDMRWVREFQSIMRGYAPEIYMLTLPTSLYRSNRYRSLNTENQGHRYFLNTIAPGHVEWRMFEPAYQYPSYLEAVLSVVSSLTVLMDQERIMMALDMVRSANPWGNYLKDDDLFTPGAVRDAFNESRAIALLTALKSVTFDQSINELAVEYCEGAWNL
jgi:hypothetical protein